MRKLRRLGIHRGAGPCLAAALVLGGLSARCGEEDEDKARPDAGASDGVAAMDAGAEPGGEMTDPGEAIPHATPLPEGTAPSRRGDMAFAFDPDTARAYLFFGDRAVPEQCSPPPSDFLSDGYVFDARTDAWSALVPVDPDTAPIPRARASAVWDAQGQRVILFGGRYRDGTRGPYDFPNDLWAYEPATGLWTELAPSGVPGAPEGRMNAGMVYDARRNWVILYGGGYLTPGLQYVLTPGLWAYDLGESRWIPLRPETRPAPDRLFHSVALDTRRDRLYVFGGGDEGALFNPVFFSDLWYVDLSTRAWTQVPREPDAAWPAGRIKATLDYDAARDRLIMFAGHDDTALGNENDVWQFSPETGRWARLIEGDTYANPQIDFCDFPADFATFDPNSPERRESHLFLIMGDEALMYGGRTDCGLANDTWRFDLGTDSWHQVTNSLSGMTCYRSGRLDCDAPGARKCG